MTSKSYLILLFFIPFFGAAQKQIDSITSLIKTEKSATKKTKLYYTIFNKLHINTPEIAKKYIDSIEAISAEHKNDTISAILAMTKGSYNGRVSNFEKSIKDFNEAAILYDKIKDYPKKANALHNVGINQRRNGKYELAMESTLASLRIRDSINASPQAIANSYISLGSIYGDLKNFDESNEYFKKAIAIFKEKKNEAYVAHLSTNLATNLKAIDKHEEAIKYYKVAIDFYEKSNSKYYLCIAYNGIGSSYNKLKQYETAKLYHTKALNISKAINQPELQGVSLNNIGSILLGQKNYKEALPFFLSSLELNKKIDAKDRASKNYGVLSDIYSNLGKYKKAFEYSKLRFTSHDSIISKENLAKINELNIQYETEKKEAAIALQDEEIKTLNVQAKNDKLTKTLYGIGMFSFITIAGLLYFGFKQRIKKNKIAREKEEEKLKQEIAFKKKELTSQTLHLVQKSTFIQELKENLEKIKQSPELFKVEFRRLVMLLKKQSAEDKDWEVFKSYFSEVHNNFDNKIKAIAQDITEKEIRLASFLRMNLSTKEIASMLNVLPDSVLKSKYRLKKKLQLDKEADLTEFLNTL